MTYVVYDVSKSGIAKVQIGNLIIDFEPALFGRGSSGCARLGTLLLPRISSIIFIAGV